MSAPCDISIIVVSYNVCALLDDCLRSVERQAGVSYEIFVVDNASGDGSADLVRTNYPQVHLIAGTENLGFARANNRVLNQTRGRFIYYLNPDTVLPAGALAGICAFMEQHPETGIASTRLLFPDGSDQPAVKYRHDGARYTRGELDGLPGSIAWVIGASMVARRDLMLQTGGFDERFFMYGEDEDLCLSVRKLGSEVGFIKEVKVIHYQGQSEKSTPSLELIRKKSVGSLVFYEKHYRVGTLRRICRAGRTRAVLHMLCARLNPGYFLNAGTARARYARARLEWELFSRWRQKWIE
ncbi:MAG: glycosyltransferase family 2 protein [Kiritimatiellae bacterium]|nr:glycosyltransferase family 2 protein [Kiritimatiellia bacterium]